MERLLAKLAHKLNTLDENSLSGLWETYMTKVNTFEPTQEWEEAALCLSMIQGLRWKNQLFNYHFKQKAAPTASDILKRADIEPLSLGRSMELNIKAAKTGKILSFPPHSNTDF